jgi:hypothetical protein
MLRSTFVVLATFAFIADARFPRQRPDEPDSPNSPSNPSRNPGNGPGTGPGGGSSGFEGLVDIAVPSQEDIELNMGDLELDLQSKENDTMEGSVTLVVGVVLDIVSAILADPDCIRGDTFSGGGFQAGTSTECKSAACEYYFSARVQDVS